MLYVVDAAAPSKVAEAAVALFGLLQHQQLQVSTEAGTRVIAARLGHLELLIPALADTAVFKGQK